MCVCLCNKEKKIVLCVGILLAFWGFVAILDFIFAFISMEFIREQFEQIIYINALTYQKVGIYILTRGIMLLFIVFIKKEEIVYEA